MKTYLHLPHHMLCRVSCVDRIILSGWKLTRERLWGWIGSWQENTMRLTTDKEGTHYIIQNTSQQKNTLIYQYSWVLFVWLWYIPWLRKNNVASQSFRGWNCSLNKYYLSYILTSLWYTEHLRIMVLEILWKKYIDFNLIFLCSIWKTCQNC